MESTENSKKQGSDSRPHLEALAMKTPERPRCNPALQHCQLHGLTAVFMTSDIIRWKG